MDLWLKPDNQNKILFCSALQETIGTEELPKAIEALDFTRPLAFSFWEKPEKVDILTYINLVSFEEAEEKIVWADFEGLKIPFLHLNHLILSKMNTGRTQDLADIEALQQIKAQKPPTEP